MFKATGIRPKCSDQLGTAGYPLPMDMFEHVHLVGVQPERSGDAWRHR
jgi:hypothetical protein